MADDSNTNLHADEATIYFFGDLLNGIDSCSRFYGNKEHLKDSCDESSIIPKVTGICKDFEFPHIYKTICDLNLLMINTIPDNNPIPVNICVGLLVQLSATVPSLHMKQTVISLPEYSVLVYKG